MASKILNVLNNIERERKEQITAARANGYNVEDNASFGELAVTIGTKDDEIPKFETPYDTDEDWERPAEWIDCYSILRNAEPKENDEVACYILLLKDDSDEIKIDKYYSGTNISSLPYGANYHGCDYFLLSDGAYVDVRSNDVTHTWDKSKDIIIENGEYAGTYRYMLGYKPKNTARNIYAGISTWKVVEIIIGQNEGTGAEPTLWLSNFGYEPLRNPIQKTLLHYEVLPSAITNSIGSSFGSTMFSFLVNLKKFEVNKPVTFQFRNANAFTYLHSIRHLDFSNHVFNHNYSAGGPTLYGCFNLIDYIDANSHAISSNGSAAVKISGCYKLERLIAPNSKLHISYSTGYAGYIPSKAYIEVSSINQIPINWSSNKNIPIGERIDNCRLSSYYFPYPNLTEVNIEYATQLSSSTYCVYYSGTTLYDFGNEGYVYSRFTNSIKHIHFPENIIYRLDLSPFNLDKDNIIETLNRLKDLTGETVYTPNIKLGINYDKLTDEEIAIATNKGWTVIY